MTVRGAGTVARGGRPAWAAFLPPCYLVAVLVLGVPVIRVTAPYEGPVFLWLLLGVPLVGVASIVSVLLMLTTRRSPWKSPPLDALLAAGCGLGVACLLALPLLALLLGRL